MRGSASAAAYGSVGDDQNGTWTYTVARRTAKSVWVCLHHTGQDINPAKAQRVSIRVHDGEETCRPLGSYSMSPILGAGKEI